MSHLFTAAQGLHDSLRAELIHDGSRVRTTMVNLPAANTPQHSWSKNRMPFKPQPVPPIYQPELAARGIYHAAHHDRREWNLGLITDVVVGGNALLPGVGDCYLAKTGYEAQLTDERDDLERPHNLYEPLPGDWGHRAGAGGRPTRWQARGLTTAECRSGHLGGGG